MDPNAATTSDSGVSYFRAADVVLCARSPLARVKLCRIKFGKDRSIYISFPYLREKRGILSTIRDTPGATGPRTYDFRGGGVVVSVDVKFSHHTSGMTGFSLTGLMMRLPRAAGFPLEAGTGPIFQLHAHQLSGFTWLEEGKTKARDLVLGFDFTNAHPFAVRVESHWWKKSVVAANTFGSTGDGPSRGPGPRVEAFNRHTGLPRYFLFLGQPLDSPLQEHILAVTIEAVPVPTGAETPGMVFLGGFGREESGGTTALAFMYPFTGVDDHEPA
jgi:hypothetical protein